MMFTVRHSQHGIYTMSRKSHASDSLLFSRYPPALPHSPEDQDHETMKPPHHPKIQALVSPFIFGVAKLGQIYEEHVGGRWIGMSLHFAREALLEYSLA